MNKPQIKIINVETGEEIVRDATAAEITQLEKDSADEQAQKTAATNKATARQAILDRLGLTAEEAALLLS
jgi:hypothetical protein